MTAIIQKEIDNRAIELKRQAFVAKVESDCLDLCVGESKTFKFFDLQSLQRLKTRFSRLKDTAGRDLRTTMDGNNVTVTRYDDEEIR